MLIPSDCISCRFSMRFNMQNYSTLEHNFNFFFLLPDRLTHHHKRWGNGKWNILLGWPYQENVKDYIFALLKIILICHPYHLRQGIDEVKTMANTNKSWASVVSKYKLTPRSGSVTSAWLESCKNTLFGTCFSCVPALIGSRKPCKCPRNRVIIIIIMKLKINVNHCSTIWK